MADVTLLELDLEGAESTIHLPFSGGVRKFRGESEEKSDGSRRGQSESGGGRSKIALLAGLAVFVLLVGGIAKRRSGSDSDGGLDLGADEEEEDVMAVTDD